MLNLSDLSRIKGFRFPRAVIGYAVWADHRFALSLRDVEDLLAARGVRVSYETVRDWVARFGGQFAARIRRERPGLRIPVIVGGDSRRWWAPVPFDRGQFP